MNYLIKQANLKGTYQAIPSKSITHRLLLLATLKDSFEINNALICNDTLETINFIKAIGFNVTINDKTILVSKSHKVEEAFIYLKESASTLRFIIPFSLLHVSKLTISLSEVLKKRFNDVYPKIFENTSVKYYYDNDNIIVSGKLTGGNFTIPEVVSSQFATGLILTLPFINEDSTLNFSKIPSMPYFKLTLSILKSLGVNIVKKEESYLIKGNSLLNKSKYHVENDYSLAANFLVLKKLGAEIDVKGLNKKTFQGDKKIMKFLEKDSSLFNIINYPDLGPILFVYAVLMKKEVTIKGINNLIYKESDRLNNMLANLSKVNAKFKVRKNSVTFYPSNIKGGVKVLGYNDHRIVMSMAVLATFLKDGLVITNGNSVNKSYAEFFNDLKKLGGNVNVV